MLNVESALDFLIQNEDGSFSMPIFESGDTEIDNPSDYTPLDLETIEGKIIHFGQLLECINDIVVSDKNLPPDAKAQMALNPCIDALYKAGDIISTLIDKMEASCCTLDETIVKVAKNEADIVILKAK